MPNINTHRTRLLLAIKGIITSSKDSVRVATTLPGTLATSFNTGDTVDGVVLAEGDRILVKDQDDASENGIRVVADSGVPARAQDADNLTEGDAEVKGGMAVFVNEGSQNADSMWQLTTDDPIELDVTDLVFAQLGLPAGTDYVTPSNINTITGAKTFNAGTLLDKGSIVLNVKAYGAVGDGVADDTTAIQAAINAAGDFGIVATPDSDDYINHDQRGINVYLPSGTYLLSSPLLMPRSGTYRSRAIGLIGQKAASTRLTASGSFPSDRALLEWDPGDGAANHRRVRDQYFEELTFIPKNAVGSMCVWFKVVNSQASYGTDVNSIDSLYNCQFKNIILTGHNQYHNTLMKLEGRIDFCNFENITGDCFFGATPTYSSRVLVFDDLATWPLLTGGTYEISDSPGLNFSKVDGIYTGFRGGRLTLVDGRVHQCTLANLSAGNGALNQDPYVYIRDGGRITAYNWVSEGFGEDGQYKFQNCVGIHLRNFGLGTPDEATGANPGTGLKLINVRRSVFEDRQVVSGFTPFSTYSSKLVSVDANCKDISFVNFIGNGSYATEWDVSTSSRNIDIDYLDITNNVRTLIKSRQVPEAANTVGGNRLLSCHPLPVGFAVTANLTKDLWRIVPFKLDNPTPVSAIKVQTTAAASGGTAAMIFGIFSSSPGGRPETRVVDLSTYGSIDLTAVAGIQTLTTTGLILPAGEYWLGVAWAGTATTGPTVQALNTSHPAIAGATPGDRQNAYTVSVSGATVPETVSTSTASLGLAVWITLA